MLGASQHIFRVGEIAEWLRVLTALVENPGLVCARDFHHSDAKLANARTKQTNTGILSLCLHQEMSISVPLSALSVGHVSSP